MKRLAMGIDNAWEYDPAANRWTVLPRMPIPRHGLAGAVIGNRLHLVSGDV